MRPKLSIDAAVTGNDLRAAVDLARRSGAQGVLVTARSPALDVTSLSGTGVREFRHVLDSGGLQLAGLQHALGPQGLAPHTDIDRAITEIDAVLHTASRLQTMACIDLGRLPPPPVQPVAPPTVITPRQAGLILVPDPPAPAPPPTPQQPRDHAFESSLNVALREIGRSADRYCVVIAFSAMLAPMAALEHALHAVDCPWFGVDLDPLALLADEEDRDAILSRVGSLLRHVRARDGVRGTGNRVRTLPLGQGEIDPARLVSDLDAAGYRGFITVDLRDLSQADSTAAAAAVRLLRDVISP